ncbi:type I phosphatidylinositol 4,5-bisphosphate 4-phosphatase-B-like isoform X2 [Limulus polyphemus]|uniref:Phosphatidylinositol-4,5-bisphosphate 4-phosphatase n=1 Tax=Limulus polyphemus TaxID=6850 RepID=A0ABM1S5R2_LIMPO|nr:type I phosphatidylinositol 4,5-bisphosphate 4-phosphatase-B-like isoform X2 [Limulus polyphemus]
MSEKSPLLQNEQRNYAQGSQFGERLLDLPVPTAPPTQNEGHLEVENVLPPPYSPYSSSAGAEIPMIPCKVCHTMIDIQGKLNQFVVKCNNCNEATPIKNAPPGKKYVRCVCNCLLICKAESQKIICPRPNCKRVTNLATHTVSQPVTCIPGMCRISCGHCHSTFLFNTLSNSLARCCSCRKVSSVGYEFARRRGFIYLLLAFVFLIIALGLTIGTYEIASTAGGIVVVYIVTIRNEVAEIVTAI